MVSIGDRRNKFEVECGEIWVRLGTVLSYSWFVGVLAKVKFSGDAEEFRAFLEIF